MTEVSKDSFLLLCDSKLYTLESSCRFVAALLLHILILPTNPGYLDRAVAAMSPLKAGGTNFGFRATYNLNKDNFKVFYSGYFGHASGRVRTLMLVVWCLCWAVAMVIA